MGTYAESRHVKHSWVAKLRKDLGEEELLGGRTQKSVRSSLLRDVDAKSIGGHS